MSKGEYLLGAGIFALMLVGVLVGAVLLLRRRFPQLGGIERALAWSLIATLGLLAVHLLPLGLGVLSRWTVLAATVAWVAAAWRTPPIAPEQADRPPPAWRPSSPIAWVLAAVILAGVALFALVWARNQITSPSRNTDWLNFHGPGVAAWIGSGTLWNIDVYLADLAPGHYPNNGDVMYLATILPWRQDFLAHFAMYPYYFLTGLATYALAVEVRAPRAAAAAAAGAALAIPVVAIPTLLGGLVDSLMLFSFLTGLLFLVRHARNGRTSELVLAGLALGVSFGTKWYAVSSVVVVLVVWAAAMLVARRGVRTVARQGLALTGLTALGGGIWMLRNLVESANPVFPVKVELLGQTIFDAPRDPIREASGWTIAHYLDDFDVWNDTILPQYRDAIAAPAALALAGVLVAALVLVARRRRAGSASLPRRGIVLAGLACFILLTIAYSITPYTAGGAEGEPLLTGADSRYWIPALLVALVLAAWTAGVWKRGPEVLCAIALVAVVHGLDRTKTLPNFGFGPKAFVQVLGVLILLGAVALAALPALLPLQGRAERRALAVLGALAAVVVLAGGYKIQDRYADARYIGLDPVTDVLLTEAGSDQRVGLVASWPDDGVPPPLPAFGPRFRNEVEYVGSVDKDVFRRYRTTAAFTAAVRRGDYDYLVVGRGRDVSKPGVREERFAEAAGYTLVKRSPRLSLYRRG